MPTPPPAPARLLLVLTLHLFVAVLANAATPSQEAALLAWKSSLGDPAALSTWTNATAACAGWRGVACDAAGRVSALRLRSLGLAGGLDALDVAALPSLAELDLNGNNFVGPIPAGLSRLRALAVLDLGSNGFNGSIPPQLGDLTGLVELRLYNNNLAGAIPYQLSRLPRIVTFNLGSNYLTNPDYSRFSAMPTVKNLLLYLNFLNGSFPDFVLGCGNVTYLDLSQNAISEPVPDALPERLLNLRYLNLSTNAFSGPIPASFARLTGLHDLRIAANNFTGGVPEFLGSMSQLRVLELGGCPLGGRLPPVLGQLQKLQRLDVNSAGLVSVLPPELGKLGSLDFLDLSKNQLSGSLPPQFAGMRKMREFGISSNNLSGRIPGTLFDSWPELISFQVQTNSLTGKIPPALGKATKLNYLYLFNNSLTGSIPSEVGELVNLQELDLSGNSLTGPIPRTVGNLKQLTRLALFFNRLNGAIPPEIGNMTALVNLDVNTNNLEGELPATISLLKNLQTLALFDNNLSGTVPSDLGEGIALADVSFTYNGFSGELPQKLCDGLTLQNFTADHNNFSGKLPPCLKNCTKLFRVRLEGNDFTGDISQAFGVHPGLDYLDVSGNKLSGQLSNDWGQCVNVTRLHMDGNRISGGIPAAFGTMASLQDLSLAENNLTGAIPPELGYLSFLFQLNLSSNSFSGPIPANLGNISKLQKLDLSDNMLNGTIPLDIGKLGSLTYLDLSKNKLMGQMPSELGNLDGLQTLLDLSSNSLSGAIPSNLVKLTNLQKLNVSHNQLSGSIPSGFSRMSSLETVDFSYNQLTGEIPSGNAFNASLEAYIGNVGLCGNMQGMPSCDSPAHSGRHKRTIIEIVFSVIGAVLLLAIVACLILACRRRPREQKVPEASTNDSYEAMIWEKESKFVFLDIVHATNSFNESFCIGKGGFGSVYRAELASGQVVAVKRFHLAETGDISEASKKSFENEIKALTEVRHRNIVKLHGFCTSGDYMYLVYEYLERGSLGKTLYGEEGKKKLDWGMRVKVIQGVAHALAYLHHDCNPPIVHRDITVNNILLESEFEPRLSDFGTAKLLGSASTNWTSVAGSYGYMAPGGYNLMSCIKEIPTLKGDNYGEWKKKIDLAFILAEVDWVLTTACPTEPEEPVRKENETDAAWQTRQRDFAPLKMSYDLEHRKWTTANKKCMAVIKNTIEPAIVGSIAECDTVTEYIERIKSQFTGSSKTYATQVIRQLVNEKYSGGNGGIREHILRMSNMASKLKPMDLGLKDALLIHLVFTSLPKEFETFIVNYNMQPESWDLEKCIAMCVQEEDRIKASHGGSINYVKDNKRKHFNNYSSKNKGKASVHQPHQNKFAVDKDQCLHCKKTGHYKKDCPSYLKMIMAKKGIPFDEDYAKKRKMH